ncbi:MAG: hypothetical protein AB1627_15345 [Chloroflexota bacterium]
MAARVHPIQLADIRVDRATSFRRKRVKSDPLTHIAHIPRPRLLDVAADRRSFRIVVSTRVRVPLAEDDIWVGVVRMVATLVSDEDVPDDLAVAFARLSGVFLVWPYARLYVDQLGKMAGVAVPPLPLLSRPGSVTAPERRP